MSTLHVENLKGLSSGSNANKIIIPTGQTIEVMIMERMMTNTGQVIQKVHNTWNSQTATQSSFVDDSGSIT